MQRAPSRFGTAPESFQWGERDDRGPRGSEARPPNMPTMLADGLGLESGLESRCRDSCAPSRCFHREFGFPAPALRKEAGFRRQGRRKQQHPGLSSNAPQPLARKFHKPFRWPGETGVAQVSKPAVSPISQSAGRRIDRSARRFRNLRSSRLGGLRYFEICEISGLALWP